MKTIITLLALFMSAQVLTARIGESMAQCEARYGKALLIEKDIALVLFFKNGYAIQAHFFEGTVDRITYAKPKTTSNLYKDLEPLSTQEIETLLGYNGADWAKDKDVIDFTFDHYQTPGKTNLSLYHKFDHTLVIGTIEHYKRAWAKSDAEKQKALDGL
jgi:hypothetical protein